MTAPGNAARPLIQSTVCAVCGAHIPRGRLMCPKHWHMVPKPLQVAVWRTWRAFTARKTPGEGVARLRDYREAADAAIAAVQARLPNLDTASQPSQPKEHS